MKILRGSLVVAVAGALSLASCTSIGPDARRGALEVRPVHALRHGMSAEQIYRLGRMLQDAGRDDEAFATFREALMVDPTHADAHNALGVIYAMRGKADLAEEEFRTAISFAPQAQYLRQNLAHHLVRSSGAPETTVAAPPPSEVAQTAPPAAAPAGAAPPVPALRLERLSESVWQLRSDHMLRELADLPAFEAPQAPVPASAFRVEVANGNGAAGLARRVSTLLPPRALQPARLTNQKPYGATLSVIEHVAGAEQEAAAVNARLPAQLPLFRVHALERSAQVRVLLGRDFPRDVETHEAALPATRLAAS